MGRLIGGIDGEQKHHRDTGGDGEVGGLGHVAVRRGGHKLRKGRKNKRLGHRDAGACRWKKPDPAVVGPTAADKVPVPAKAVNELRQTVLSPGRKWSLRGCAPLTGCGCKAPQMRARVSSPNAEKIHNLNAPTRS